MAMAWSRSSSNVISHPPLNRGRLQEVIEDQQRAGRCRWRPIRRQCFVQFVRCFSSDQEVLVPILPRKYGWSNALLARVVATSSLALALVAWPFLSLTPLPLGVTLSLGRVHGCIGGCRWAKSMCR